MAEGDYDTRIGPPELLDECIYIYDLAARIESQQAGDPFHVHHPRIHGVGMDGPCIHFHPFHRAGRYIIHPSTPGFRGMDAWKWKQGYGLVGVPSLVPKIPYNSGWTSLVMVGRDLKYLYTRHFHIQIKVSLNRT